MTTTRCLVIGAVVAGWLGATVAAADTLAPQKSSQVVRLSSSGASCTIQGAILVDQLQPADGTVPVPFTIPDKKVLVVTGVNWIINVAVASQLLRTTRVSLASFVSPPATLLGLFLDTALVGPGAAGVFKASPVPGVIVKPGVEICAAVDSDVGTLGGAIVHGFLAPDR